MYLTVVEAEVLMTTCHYCERVLKQGCRNEESFQAEVTESKRLACDTGWLVLLGDAGATFPPQEEKYCGKKSRSEIGKTVKV